MTLPNFNDMPEPKVLKNQDDGRTYYLSAETELTFIGRSVYSMTTAEFFKANCYMVGGTLCHSYKTLTVGEEAQLEAFEAAQDDEFSIMRHYYGGDDA